jgi:MFS family permease
VVATVEPDTSATAAAAQQVVYVHTPPPPRKKGNRAFGTLIAVLAAVLYAAVLAVGTALIGVAGGSRFTFGFLADARFYIPVLFFLIGFILLVLVLNRANWWAYILGSVVLAVFVYFGTVGAGLLGAGVISRTPAEAGAMYVVSLRDPFVIVAALLAREVSIWIGAGIASRGRRLKAHNAQAKETYEQELAKTKAEHERGTVAAPTAV